MDLHRLRKDAKALLRAHRAGAADAHARARHALGGRAVERFRLGDAQHVIAVELGFRSWPRLQAAARATVPIPDAGPPPVERLEAPTSYAPGDPVRLRIVNRRWPEVDDEGGAVLRAGRPAGWRAATARLARELEVNANRAGVLSLPVVPCGPGRAEIVRRVAEASAVLYGQLLELGEEGRRRPATSRRP